MEKIVGTLTEIGPAKTRKKDGWTKYSYIKVDGRTIMNVYSTRGIKTVLYGQVNDGQITIHVGKMAKKKTIFAITQADGQTFRASAAQQFLGVLIMQPLTFIAAGVLYTVSEAAAVIFFFFMQAILGYALYKGFEILSIKADHIF